MLRLNNRGQKRCWKSTGASVIAAVILHVCTPLSVAAAEPVETKQYSYYDALGYSVVRFVVSGEMPKTVRAGMFPDFARKGTLSECVSGLMCLDVPGVIKLHIPSRPAALEANSRWEVDGYTYRSKAVFAKQDGDMEFLIEQYDANGSNTMSLRYSYSTGIKFLLFNSLWMCDPEEGKKDPTECIDVLMPDGDGLLLQ
ncbi:hypothetical protein [Gimibacter soli]|uniref:Uncharacterized protein n=1 Tax=Gimibacter soli TaxID=3024400 RepID=A0AAE9XV03_9PROT|nr:hypothetical protein [Gimibacter soli]WCL54198.1 hypothetical protein PH603_00305 [Gimibacter soli]